MDESAKSPLEEALYGTLPLAVTWGELAGKRFMERKERLRERAETAERFLEKLRRLVSNPDDLRWLDEWLDRPATALHEAAMKQLRAVYPVKDDFAEALYATLHAAHARALAAHARALAVRERESAEEAERVARVEREARRQELWNEAVLANRAAFDALQAEFAETKTPVWLIEYATPIVAADYEQEDLNDRTPGRFLALDAALDPDPDEDGWYDILFYAGKDTKVVRRRYFHVASVTYAGAFGTRDEDVLAVEGRGQWNIRLAYEVREFTADWRQSLLWASPTLARETVEARIREVMRDLPTMDDEPNF